MVIPPPERYGDWLQGSAVEATHTQREVKLGLLQLAASAHKKRGMSSSCRICVGFLSRFLRLDKRFPNYLLRLAQLQGQSRLWCPSRLRRRYRLAWHRCSQRAAGAFCANAIELPQFMESSTIVLINSFKFTFIFAPCKSI